MRDSQELRDFHAWLSTTENASDNEIRDAVKSVKSRLGNLTASPAAKAFRFAITTAIGLIPGAGLIAGPAASAADTFLVDELLPKSGVVAFLTKTYPSLFVSP